MSQQLPDPTGWLTDLMKAQHTVLWPAGDIFDTSEALAASADGAQPAVDTWSCPGRGRTQPRTSPLI